MESELLKIEKLIGTENWCTWKFQVKILLNAGDLFGCITDPKPIVKPEDAASAAKELEWVKMDKKAQRVIATTVSHQPLIHIMNCNTASEMWKKLECVYEQKSEANIHMLQQKFYSITKDPSDDIATHISRVETLVQQLKDAGEHISSSMLMTKILMTLPPSFNHFCSAWESTAEKQKTMENLTSRLIMEESRIKAQTQESTNTNAFMAKRGNQTKPDQKNGDKFRKRGKCFICKRPGHWKKDCPSKKGSSGVSASSAVYGDAFICEAGSSSIKHKEKWFLDSGATDHMSFRRDWFVNYEQFTEPQSVRVGNGNIIYAYGCGNINVLAFDKTNWVPKHLSKVLYVPDIKLNLFSSSAALDKNLRMVSDSHCCEFLKGDKVVAVGVREDFLFKMMFKANVTATANIAAKCESVDVWHQRFAHQNISLVRDFLKRKNIVFQDDLDFFCEPCVIGKQHRRPFEASKNRASISGELVHVDLCGPMQTTSIGGSRYFLLFKDDFTRFRVVYFLKSKEDAFGCFVKYINKVKMDTNHCIKTIRTDNGLEFVNKEVKKLLDNNRIRHQTTVPFSPQQNGRAERDMRTIVEAARTMLYTKRLSLNLWAEAVNMAVFVFNLTASTFEKDKSPADLWFHDPSNVNISELKIFGTECFVHVPKERRKKWDAKSKKGFFVGYPENVKGYRVYIPESRKVEISRDVIFRDTEPRTDCVIKPEKPDSKDRKEEENKKISLPSSSSTEEFEDASDFENPETENVYNSEPSVFSDTSHESGDSNEIKTSEKSSEEQQGADADPNQPRYFLRKPKSTPLYTFMAVMQEGNAFTSRFYEPVTYKDACSCEDAERWKVAMQEEMEALKKNNTWELVHPPENKKVIDNKWVFKIKSFEGDLPIRYKARLVIRGFNQQKGIDYQETFSPVAKFSSIRMLLSVVAMKGLQIMQFDVKTAFLNGDLEDEILMKQPQGFEDGTGRVCRLRRSLYGLKQASRCWNKKFTKFLTSFQLKQSEADPCVFIGKSVLLALYIDDGLVAAESEREIMVLINYLQKNFEIKVCEAKIFLGLEIKRTEDGSIHLGQRSYIDKILSRFNMENARSISTPADSSVYTTGEANNEGKFPFREAVGSLMYLAIGTRPDISFALGIVSRFLDSPTAIHVNAVKRIMRYLKGTRDLGIILSSKSSLKINYFSDADYAGDPNTRRSTSGYFFLLGSSPISWASQRQKSVALSTTEAEYVAAASAVADMLWSKRLLEEIEGSHRLQSTLFMDNQSAIRLVKNPEFHKRSKHIEVKYHFIREKFSEGLFRLEYVASNDQLADILTKPLTRDKFQRMRSLTGVRPFSE